MNVLDKHYLDRDLNRSGNSVVMITAGPGVFNVDGKLSGEPRHFLPGLIFSFCLTHPRVGCVHQGQ